MMERHEIATRLNAVLDRWNQYANGVEAAFGLECPVSRAYRQLIGELEMVKTEIVDPEKF